MMIDERKSTESISKKKKVFANVSACVGSSSVSKLQVGTNHLVTEAQKPRRIKL